MYGHQRCRTSAVRNVAPGNCRCSPGVVAASGWKTGTGPSGFTYYPGTGLAERYDHHFFLCNYTGNGGIESFSIVPRGAGFEIVDEQFSEARFATDCEFGYDGRLYVSDFVNLIWNGGSSSSRSGISRSGESVGGSRDGNNNLDGSRYQEPASEAVV